MYWIFVWHAVGSNTKALSVADTNNYSKYVFRIGKHMRIFCHTGLDPVSSGKSPPFRRYIIRLDSRFRGNDECSMCTLIRNIYLVIDTESD